MPADLSAGLWWTRVESGSGESLTVDYCGYDTADHAPGEVIEAARADLVPIVHTALRPAASRVTVLLVNGGEVAPTLWWVEHPQTSHDPPAMVLMAFTGHGQAAGSVIDQAGFRASSAASGDQYGAVQWWPSTGQVTQIYVAPELRRQGIGSALLFGAAAYSRARQWPKLWGSGQRTDLGEVFLSGAHEIMAARIESRTHRLAPMTPAERAVGLPRHLLEPDA